MSITVIENAIVERLRAVLPEGMVKRVYTAREVAEIDERSQVSPALFVVYTGLNPGTSLGRGQVQQVTYGFAVIVSVRSARSTIDGKGQRDEASPIIDAVIENCTGVQLAIPDLSLTPLELAPSPASGFSDAGFGYYPIAFNTTRTYRGPTQRR